MSCSKDIPLIYQRSSTSILNSIIFTLVPQYIYYDSKLLAPVVWFAELVYTSMCHLGRVTCFVHLILYQTSKEEIECTKAEEKLRCGIFGFCLLSFPQNGRKIYKLRQFKGEIKSKSTLACRRFSQKNERTNLICLP